MSSLAAVPTNAIDPFVEAYESARQQNGRARLADHLPPHTHPDFVQVLVELIRVELEYDWGTGTARPLDDYLTEFPELQTDGQLLAEVAYEEYRQRWDHGHCPSRDEYGQRYGIDTRDWAADEGPQAISESVKAERKLLRERALEVHTPPPRRDLDVSSVRLPDGAQDAARAFRLFQQSGSLLASSAFGPAPLPPEVARVFADLQASSPAAAARFAQAITSFPEVGGAFAGFHLIAELGRGAFGRVFLARQEELADRLVALKVGADLSGEPQTLAQLQHTNIVPVYSVHKVGSLQAVCMPYFGSVTLADVVRDLVQTKSIPGSGQHFVSTLNNRRQSKSGRVEESRASGSSEASAEPDLAPISANTSTEFLTKLVNFSYVEAVLWLAARLADGLGHAHDRGVVHRDLKPANVLLTDEGQPMLLDFNLADDANARDPASAARVGGTLPYMAPEHLAAFRDGKSKVDARSDIYSLGVLLFELLAGRHPFPTLPGPMQAILPDMITQREKGPPGLRSFNPSLSPATESIVLKCLASRPDERYQSAQELKEDLERQLSHRPLVHASEPSIRERARKWARRNPRLTSSSSLAGLAVVFVLGLGLAGFGWWTETRRHEAIARADEFHKQARGHKAALGIGTADPASLDIALGESRRTLALYGLPNDPDWESRAAVSRLSESARADLRRDVGELLFLTARGVDRSAGTNPERLAEAARLSELASACFPPDERPASFITQAKELQARLEGGASANHPQAKEVATPRSTREAYLAALDLAAQGRFKEALPLAQRAVEAEPNLFAARVALGHCYYGLGNFFEAQSAYDTSVALAPEFHWAYYNRGLARLRQKNFRGACADFDTALRHQPGMVQAFVNRAIAREFLQDDAGVVSDLTRAMELGAPQSWIYFRRAEAHARLGNATSAAEDARVGLRLVPTDAEGWVARGRAPAKTNPSAALADIEQALLLNPTSLSALRVKAYILSEKMWRTADAIRVLDRVAELYPDNMAARLSRKELLERRETGREANRQGAGQVPTDEIESKPEVKGFAEAVIAARE